MTRGRFHNRTESVISPARTSLRNSGLKSTRGTLVAALPYSLPLSCENRLRMTVGILAFGSIVDDPGPELLAALVRRVDVETPFAVEFARSSRTRDGAPTLVPVAKAGSPVRAVVLVVDESIGEVEARGMLYRREAGRRGDKPARGDATARWIATLHGFAGLDACLYTALPANIEPLTVDRLAELALHSAAARAGAQRRDGISYLDQQKRHGVRTPLMPGYEAAVLARTGARNLREAWSRVRAPAAA